MARESKQEKYKRWYEKGFFWVYKQNCAVCGQEFYARSKDQTVCDNKVCKRKWETIKPETIQEESSIENSGIT